MTTRFLRKTALVCVVVASAAFVWQPDRPRLGLGVVGGGVLAGLAFWAIRGLVDQVVSREKNGGIRPISRGLSLVKFFTRHVILAVTAYGMMLGLQLDPVGMIVGVTSAVVAAAFEARRGERVNQL